MSLATSLSAVVVVSLLFSTRLIGKVFLVRHGNEREMDLSNFSDAIPFDNIGQGSVVAWMVIQSRSRQNVECLSWTEHGWFQLVVVTPGPEHHKPAEYAVLVLSRYLSDVPTRSRSSIAFTESIRCSAMPFGSDDVAAFMLLASMMFLCDNEDEFLLEALQMADYNDAADFLDGTARTGKPKPHDERWWEKTARHLCSAQFKSAFRCRKPTFKDIVKSLYGTTDFCRKGARGPMFDPCERVAVFMYRLGGDCTCRQTAIQFNLSEGTVSQVTLEVARLVEERLRADYVRWPSPSEQRKMSKEWELEKGLRNVIGGIDGSHIETLAPKDNLQLAFYNYKHFYSISLLAIVDNQGLFRWFVSGAPGSCGDSGILQETDFYARVESETSKPPKRRRLMHDGACILGDSAFAESAWMRTPIGTPQTRAERFFNYKHSSQRFRVEHAFGRLKKKFRALLKGLDCRLEHCSTLLNACVVLHNFIYLREGESPAEQGLDPDQTRNGTGLASSVGAGPADSARAREVEYLRARFLVREWGQPGSRADKRRLEDERRIWRNYGRSAVVPRVP